MLTAAFLAGLALGAVVAFPCGWFGGEEAGRRASTRSAATALAEQRGFVAGYRAAAFDGREAAAERVEARSQ